MRQLAYFWLSVLLCNSLCGFNILQERYFHLDQPLSEGARSRTHPWVLNFGHAEVSQVPKAVSFLLKPSTPSAQLTFDRKLPEEGLVLVSLQLAVEPTDEEVELFDFAGALLGVVQAETGPRLRFTSYDEISETWTWLEADYDLLIKNGVVDLSLTVLIDRHQGKWAFLIGNSIFDDLSLMPAALIEEGEDQSLYILGNETSELRIQKVNITQVRLAAGLTEVRYDRFLKYQAAMEATRATPVRSSTLERPVERRRLILSEWSHSFIDQDGEQMPKVKLDDGRELTIYSGGGPQPTYIELEATIFADRANDQRFIRWDLHESDWDETFSRLLASGSFKDGAKVQIPLTPDEAGNLPVSFRIRVYFDSDPTRSHFETFK